MARARPREPADLVAAMAAGDSGPALSDVCERYASIVLALLTKMLGRYSTSIEVSRRSPPVLRRVPNGRGVRPLLVEFAVALRELYANAFRVSERSKHWLYSVTGRKRTWFAASELRRKLTVRA